MNDSENFSSSEKPQASRSIRWRRGRRVLISLAVAVTLIAGFYTVENWRGKRAWEKCKRELEAKGVVLDWNAYIPPPVPAEQNFFDEPKMAEWFIKPPFGQPNTNEFRVRLSNKNTTSEITTETAARNYLAWSDQFESDFDAIREALKRPYSRIGGDYSQPFAIRIPNFITVRTVAQTLSQRAKGDLLIGKPEKALRELTMIHDLCRLLEGKPTGKPMTLVAAMINVAVTGLYVDAVADGMRLQAWREPQLAAIQEQLKEINLLPFVESGFECERVAVCRTFEMITRKELSKIFSFVEGKSMWQRMKDPTFLLLTVAPRGWVYQNMVADAKLVQKTLEGFDLPNSLVSPEKINRAGKELKLLPRFSPYTFLASIAIPNFIRATQTAARNQTRVNEGQIVCALEQYRIAHGNYPESLDALAPQFMERIPHDIIGGQPLKYRRTDNGKFLLYSIGWNEKDDGGVPGKTLFDEKQGDWVWQYPAK